MMDKLVEVEVKYNSYLPETEILVNRKTIKQSSKLYKYKGENLNVWIDDMMDLLIEEINDEEFQLTFVGEKSYFEDIKSECAKDKKYKDIKLVHKDTKKTIDLQDNNKTKIEKLTELVEYMQNGPIEELRSEKIKESYNRAINSEFEIAVVATMSSGKSTLINAILGKDIIPAKNEACTAKISKIKNINGKKEFSVVAYDKNNKVLESHDVVTSEILKDLNENEQVGLIYIEGDIPSINADSMNLVLIDTPGPNNSQDPSHREKTMEIIKNDTYKPLVLYILNATQLGINDDNYLLTMIRDEMNSKDKQSKDRFIFVLNKIDDFDPETESIEGVINNARAYLEENGIKEPNIYPASSIVAKNIRKYLNRQELTKKEKGKILLDVELFNESENFHLLKYTPLSDDTKKALQEEIEKIKVMDSDEGYLLQALYHSGIPYIEAGINEYLEKYAIKFKIQEAIDSFRRIIEKQNIEQLIIKELEDSNQIIEYKDNQIQSNEYDINKGKKDIDKNKGKLEDTKDLINKNTKKLDEKYKNLSYKSKEITNLDTDKRSINEGISNLHNIIEEKKREANAIKSIIDNRNPDKFKKRVNDLKVDLYMETRSTKGKINSAIIKISEELKDKNQVSKYEAEQIINRLNEKISLLTSDIKTDLDRLVQKNIKDAAAKLMEEYRKEIKGLFQDNEDINMDSSSVKFIMASIPSAKEISNEYSYTKTVAVGTETVINYDKKWYKPWTWFQDETYERTKYEEKEFVDLSQIQEKYIRNIRRNLEENVDKTSKRIKEQIEFIKLDFNKKVDKFEKVLKQEVDKYNKLIKEAQKKEEDKKKEVQRLEELKEAQENLEAEKEKLENESNIIRTDNKNLTKTADEIKAQNAKIQKDILEKEKELKKLNEEVELIKAKQEAAKSKERFLNEIKIKLDEITI